MNGSWVSYAWFEYVEHVRQKIVLLIGMLKCFHKTYVHVIVYTIKVITFAQQHNDTLYKFHVQRFVRKYLRFSVVNVPFV